MPNERTAEDAVIFWQESNDDAPEQALYIRPLVEDRIEIRQAPDQFIVIQRVSLPELIKILKTLPTV